MLKKLFGLFFICMTSLSCFAEETTQQQKQKKAMMIADLDFIKNTFLTYYAPSEWKKQHFGWDLEKEIFKVKKEIEENPAISVKEYQRKVLDFLRSTRDYHVKAIYHSTEEATLPFTVKSAEGKYFITSIDRSRLSSRVYKFSVGDELLTFDDKPISEAIAHLKETEIEKSNPATDQSRTEMFLTNRFGAFGMNVPRNPVKISLKSPSGTVSSYQLAWHYTPEKIQSNIIASMHNAENDETLPLGKRSYFKKLMMTPIFEVLAKKNFMGSERDPNTLGSRESFIPDLGGKKIWESDEECEFHAYIFLNDDNKLIGYLRIPHYLFFSDEDVEDLAATIDHLEEITDALVLDQVNNPGGLVLFAYSLASMLTSEPLHTPSYREAITQEDAAIANLLIPILEEIENDEEAQELFGETLLGYPVDFQFVTLFLKYFRFINDEWKAGHYLTDPTYLLGMDQINPHPTTQYTKPILCLVNELDFSCADLLPSLLQDGKRATLFGSRTAGAGGTVTSFSYPNRFGMALMTITYSIAERKNGDKIENLGISPDIEYTLTADDLQNGYSSYVDAVLNAVDDLLDGDKEETKLLPAS